MPYQKSSEQRHCHLERVTRYVLTQDRPILIGRVSVDLKIGIAEAEFALESLVDANFLRHLTKDELKAYDLTWGYFWCSLKT